MRILFLFFTVLVLVGSSYGRGFGLEPKTIPAIVSVLQQRGEVVTAIGRAYDRVSNVEFVILKRESKQETFMLLRTVGGGADEIISDPTLINVLPEYVNYNIAVSLTEQMVDNIIVSGGGIEEFTRWAEKNPDKMKKYTELPRKCFEVRGITIK